MKTSGPLVPSLLLVVLLGTGAFLGPVPPVVGAALVVVGLAVGWAAAFGVSGPLGGAGLTGAAGVAGVLVVLLPGGERPVALPVVAAAGVVACFVHQMTRPAPRTGLTRMLAAEVAGVLLALSAAGWAAIPRSAGGPGAAPAAAAALLVALLCTLLPWPAAIAGPFAMVLGTAGAVVVAHATGVAPVTGVVTGVVATGLVGVALRLLGGGARRWPAGLAVCLAPVAAAGTAAYVAGLILPG